MELGTSIALSSLIVTTGAVFLKYFSVSAKNNKYLAKSDHDKYCSMIQSNINNKFETIARDIAYIREDMEKIREKLFSH